MALGVWPAGPDLIVIVRRDTEEMNGTAFISSINIRLESPPFQTLTVDDQGVVGIRLEELLTPSLRRHGVLYAMAQ